MTATRHVPRCQLADISSSVADLPPPRLTHHHHSRIYRARAPTDMGRKSLPHADLAKQTAANSHCARLPATNFPPLAMIKPP
jgi:hypothetical protein